MPEVPERRPDRSRSSQGGEPRRDLFPGYDVLAKRDTPSWNAKTRDVVAARLAIGSGSPRFFDAEEWAILEALCARIVPQPADRGDPVPVPALVDHKLHSGAQDGYRNVALPAQGEAWRRGLKALEAEARSAFGGGFARLDGREQDDLLARAEAGLLTDPAWGGMPCALFFTQRVLPDVVKSYYGHPTAWSEIGWGGPASPRGYVRMEADRRDPWEAAESQPGREAEALAENLRIGRR